MGHVLSLLAEDCCKCFSFIFCPDMLGSSTTEDRDTCGISPSSELFHFPPPFMTGCGRTADIRSDPMLLGLLSSVYHLLLMLLDTKIILFGSFIRLTPYLQVCLVLLMAYLPALSIKLGTMTAHNTSLRVKAGFHLHKDYATATLIDTVRDRCICNWQIGKDDLNYDFLLVGSLTVCRRPRLAALSIRTRP
eukprot:g43947.t1